MSLSQTIAYDTPADFTYNADLIEINGGGKAALKKLAYANETFFAGYHSSINGFRGLGVLTGTGAGGPTVSSGKLNLKGGTLKYVSYAAALNAAFASVGTISLSYIPNFTGLPAATQALMAMANAGTDFLNVIHIEHLSNGKFLLWILDSAGAAIFNGTTTNVFLTTAGTPINIELGLDLTGTTRLFINGVEEIATTNTGVRAASEYIRVGTSSQKNVAADFEIDSIQILSTVQHTTNFTPKVEASDYSIANPAIIVNTPTPVDAVISLSEVAAKIDAEIKYTINFGGVDKYWTGAVWATSDGTYAQANTAIEINANVGTLDLSTGGSFKLKAFLHSDDGYETPEITSNTFGYSFFVSETAPNECIIYGWVKDSKGEGVSGAGVKTIISVPFNHGNNLISRPNTATTNSDGYWEMSLVETETIVEKIQITVDSITYQITVPDAASASLASLL